MGYLCAVCWQISFMTEISFLPIELPGFRPDFKIRRAAVRGGLDIFDPVRRKWVALTPEEWVRQNMTAYFIAVKGVPLSRISCETSIVYNGLSRRCDAIVYDERATPVAIMEFKAQEVRITQSVFDQIAVYNMRLNVPYLIVSNGVTHVCCHIGPSGGRPVFLPELPDYGQMTGTR